MNSSDSGRPDLWDQQVDSSKEAWALGGGSLLAGVVALGLAIIPMILLDMRPTWLAQRPERPPEPRMQGQKSIEWHGLKFKWGGKPVEDAPAAAKEVAAAKSFAIATAIVALVGLVLGPLAWARERQWRLAAPGMGLCFLALTWQYVILGIAAGVAAAFFLLILSKA